MIPGRTRRRGSVQRCGSARAAEPRVRAGVQQHADGAEQTRARRQGQRRLPCGVEPLRLCAELLTSLHMQRSLSSAGHNLLLPSVGMRPRSSYETCTLAVHLRCLRRQLCAQRGGHSILNALLCAVSRFQDRRDDEARTMLVLRIDTETSLTEQVLADAVTAELRGEVQRAPPAGVSDARRLPAAESPKSCLPACSQPTRSQLELDVGNT